MAIAFHQQHAMHIQLVYKVVLRKENSEKDLMITDNLNEAEADKVFANLK
ncbi:hypothetical protein [Adhaeribacter pallidiroseus]|uniref:Uncharacterized protein n=1 Tax=Adhaeribacter pallidiroseus TaxID=2072847 RepID=A0A369QGT9_9BACT|nr:hypothetical protein [Adhaeribacter pallidiroseus]RDC64143.1 hypothetical protein AHMF7616_02754 [Adhaeribacter pallidiroseus]